MRDVEGTPMSARDPVPVWAVRVEEGRLHIDRKYDFARYVAAREGQHLELVLRARKVQRSTKQQAYYRGVVCDMIAEHCGISNENAHDELRRLFLTVPSESPIPKVRSTTELSVQEFQDYLAQCLHWAASFLGLVIPDPGQAESPWATD